MSRLETLNRQLYKSLVATITHKLVVDTKLQNTVKDMDSHFSKNKYSLNYEIYKELSGLPSMEFCILVQMLGLKIGIHKHTRLLMIRGFNEKK